MDIKLLFFTVILFNFIQNGMLELSCGELTVHCTGTTCGVRLYPSSEMNDAIRVKLQYRWLQFYLPVAGKSPVFKKIILQKNSPDFNTTKYNEVDFTLRIYHVEETDQGVYQVQCFRDPVPAPDGLFSSTTAEIRLPLHTPTSTPTTKVVTLAPVENSAFTPAPTIDTAVLVTLAVCSVIIVVIISATVCIVVRRKQAATEGIRRLVSRDASSEHAQRDGVESSFNVYNEIDTVDDLGAGACSANKRPTLPRRPGGTDDHSEVVYDMISNPDDQYSKINKTSASKTIHEHEIPVYAKVNKNRKRQKEQDNDDGDDGYVVMFPNINCSEIAVSLGKEYEDMSYPTKDPTRAAYENFVSRSQRSKSRKVRNSTRKELQYAILDHPDSDSESVIHSIKDQDPAITPCQYALIDFNKKAFVAPIRKAPSSWYKRKNRKTKKKSR